MLDMLHSSSYLANLHGEPDIETHTDMLVLTMPSLTCRLSQAVQHTSFVVQSDGCRV